MALFFNGEDDPSPEVIEADVFQFIRTGKSAPQIVSDIRKHFQGKVTDKQIGVALEKLLHR